MQPTTLPAPRILDALPVSSPHPLRAFLTTICGWTYRLTIATLCGMTYLSAVLLVGWLTRLVQGRVLYAWWKQSPLSRHGTFEDFTATLGPNAPTRRPRWFLRDNFSRESLRRDIHQPTADGDPPGWLRQLARVLRAPFASLFLNLQLGFLTILGTFLLVGWGTLLMTFSWEFGWLNSFTKGYEASAVGPLTGVAGLLLFSFAMLYVPMAQVHAAVTGDFRAFFEFRFVWRLIRARLTAYLFLATLYLGFGWIQEALKIAPYHLHELPAWRNASDKALYDALQQYYLACSAWLVFALLVTRLVAARIYRSAVLKAIRLGRVDRTILHPRLADWLDRLQLYPRVEPMTGPAGRLARSGARWTYRRLLFPVLFLIWVAFTAKTYVGEFLHYHPYVGFANQPLVLVPCVNHTPAALAEAANK